MHMQRVVERDEQGCSSYATCVQAHRAAHPLPRPRPLVLPLFPHHNPSLTGFLERTPAGTGKGLELDTAHVPGTASLHFFLACCDPPSRPPFAIFLVSWNTLSSHVSSIPTKVTVAGARHCGRRWSWGTSWAPTRPTRSSSQDGGTGVILFVDELHLIMAGRGSEGGGMDAANLFKPLLARGKLRCIGATT
jgi:hypothetical protein